MKSIRIYLVILFAACISQVSFGQNITNSAHDFSGEGWNSSGQICIVCHTPHNANTTVSESPLWNHEVTAATFTVYSSATLDATAGQPGASSKLCLSCHDGTVALENYGIITNGTNKISGGDNIGTNLANDHPISITYDATLAGNDGGLHNPLTTNSGLGGFINDDLLFAGKMECASCHDVHNAAGVGYLLRKSNAASALCLTCHNK